jgi:NADH:ubiquinone oxidoreductase subunit 6 (subunit J)
MRVALALIVCMPSLAGIYAPPARDAVFQVLIYVGAGWCSWST